MCIQLFSHRAQDSAFLISSQRIPMLLDPAGVGCHLVWSIVITSSDTMRIIMTMAFRQLFCNSEWVESFSKLQWRTMIIYIQKETGVPWGKECGSKLLRCPYSKSSQTSEWLGIPQCAHCIYTLWNSLFPCGQNKGTWSSLTPRNGLSPFLSFKWCHQATG